MYDNRKVEYKLKKHIATLVVENEGIVFGGYVRDSIIHDHYAKLYYKHAAEVPIGLSLYNITTYHPETALRCLTPTDVDCFFESEDRYNDFVTSLTRSNFYVDTKWSRDAKQYIRGIQVSAGELVHKRLKVTAKQLLSVIAHRLYTDVPSSIRIESIQLLRNIRKLVPQAADAIYVDVMVQTATCRRTLHPPFNALDFDCNGLMLNKSGPCLCHELNQGLGAYDSYKRMSDIIDGIVQKRTTVMRQLVPLCRYKKMLGKGWRLSGSFVVSSTAEDDDQCIICTEKLKDHECWKLSCCNAKYHIHCLSRATEHPETGMGSTNECIHCRGISFDFQQDLDMIAKISALTETPAPDPEDTFLPIFSA